MPLEERELAYLWDMLDAPRAIHTFVAGCSFDDYCANRMMKGAVERYLEIIGEAARRVSETTRQAHPDIPWPAMIGQRNVSAHEHGEVLDEAIWAIALRRIPELVEMLGKALPDEPS